MSKFEQLMVFARFPEIGKCKTRLIPALGPEGAANAHHEMTAHTLDWVNRLAERRGTRIEILAHGSAKEAFLHCFRDSFQHGRLSLSLQPAGDLGEKLYAALELAVENGAKKLAFVGTDCPDLSPELASKAFESLDSHDLCFIPACDGGYTLLAIRLADNRSAPDYRCLFEDVEWGTNSVLTQSIEKAISRSFRVRLLQALPDVDYPEDLKVWERVQSGDVLSSPGVSVIIPTFDEEAGLQASLESLKAALPNDPDAADDLVEILVVGAGQTQSVLETCAGAQVQFLEAPANRGQQLNLGASHARGSILLFLHADTRLPVDFVSQVKSTLAKENVVAGAFELAIDSNRKASRWIELGVRWRSRFLKFPYGDQALFLSNETFCSVGGFPNQPIMEDYELVRRLRRRGKIQTTDSAVVTSGRRWHELGFLRTTFINQVMIAGYHLGISVEKLAKFYRRARK
ncbi:MAG: TIGR04283 family arsenosugar biosynthesis glycosyltransferase [Aureliella sp.]